MALLRRLPHVGLLVLLAGGCKQPRVEDAERPGSERVAEGRDIRLPDPLPLPADPRVATWVARPALVLDRVLPYVPIAFDIRVAVAEQLTQVTSSELARQIAANIDLDAPFSNVVLADGEEIVRLTPIAKRREELETALAGLEPVGEFGAVALPGPDPVPGSRVGASPPAARRWLAWLDPDDRTLVLATSERGLVSARGMPAAYGQTPVFFTIDPAGIPLPVSLPFSRVHASGNLDGLHIEIERIAGAAGDPTSELPIEPGTLGGLLDGSKLALGASTRYSEHESAVKDVIREVNGQVAQLPFLVRGIGEDMAAKLNTVLRTWDGRVLGAVGPAGHLRVAYGSEDPEKAKVAMIRLLQAAVDNIKFARNFVSEVPRVTLRRGVANSDGSDIDLLVVHDAGALVPSELRSLVDSENKLNIAMAWSNRVGGGVIVAGPRATGELATWLDATKESPSGTETRQQLFAGLLATDPASVRTLAQDVNNPVRLLGLEPAASPRWVVSIERQDTRYVIDLVDRAGSGEARAKPRRAP